MSTGSATKYAGGVARMSRWIHGVTIQPAALHLERCGGAEEVFHVTVLDGRDVAVREE